MMKFLKKLHNFYKGEEVTLYLDNLKMHYNHDVVDQAHSFGFEMIYAPIISSEF